MKNFKSLYVVIAAAFWGSMGVFSKIYTSLGYSAAELVFIKSAIVFAAIAAFAAFKNRGLFKLKKPSDLLYFFGAGVLSHLFFSLCYVEAINRTDMGVAAVLLYTSPAFVAVISRLVFKERLTGGKLAAIAATFAGCVLVTGIIGEGSAGYSSAGIMFGLLSGFGYSLYSIFGAGAIKKGYSPLTVTMYAFMFTMLFSLPFINPVEFAARATGDGMWQSFIVYSVVQGILPYTAYTIGLSMIEAGKASIIATVEPVVAAMLGVAVFGEKATWMKLAGIILVILAVAMTSGAIRKKAAPQIFAE